MLPKRTTSLIHASRTKFAPAAILLIGIAAIALYGQAGQDSVTGGSPILKSKSSPSTEQPQSRIKVTAPIVTAPVIVQDSSGQYVYDLQEKDFKVFDEGTPQTITRVEAAMDPVSVVIVVQASDSTAPLLDQIRPLGSVFSGLMLGDKGEAAVIFYSDRVQLAQDFSNDPEKLKKTFGEVASTGKGQHLNDALARAINMLGQRPNAGRRLIVVFSDTSDHGSNTSADEIVRLATHDEVTIYGLGFSGFEALMKKRPGYQAPNPINQAGARPSPPGVVATPTVLDNIYNTPIPAGSIAEAAGEEVRSTVLHNHLESYADYTGGVFYSHWKGHKLQDQLSAISKEIQSQYELAYAPNDFGQTGFHRIEIQVDRPGVTIRTRAGYFVPEKKP